MLSKNVNNKKCAPKLIFLSENKLRKIRIIFDIENWLWKSNFGTFWHLPTAPIFKIQEFPLGKLILRQKSFLFCTPRLKTRQPTLPYFWPQMGARTILCTRFKCRLSLQLSGKALVHKWQAYGFSPFNKIWTQY